MRLVLLLGGVSALAVAGSASAQTSPAAPSGVEEVVVTGSRIIRNGNNAPTPLTVADAEQLKLVAPSNLSQGLAQLPAFQNSGPGRSVGAVITGANGNFLSLRNLGNVRTAILLDGQRMPPTTYTGQVDVDVIPEMLVTRVDVVTGGASAAYGSDAVAGVTNYILDTRFKGLKVELQGGMSGIAGFKPGPASTPVQRGCCDGESYRFGVAFGASLLDDRAHFQVAAEQARSEPVIQASRPYMNNEWWLYVPLKPSSAGAFGTAANPYVLTRDVRNSSRSFGGSKITGCTPAPCPAGVNNMRITPNGQVVTWDPGIALGDPSVQIGGGGMGSPSVASLIPGLQQNHVFSRLDFDVTPSINLWGQVVYGRNITHNNASGASLSNHPIFSGNPYLPASIQAAMTAAGTERIAVGEYIPQAYPLHGLEKTDSLILSVGVKVDLPADWKLDATYQRGRAKGYNVNDQPNNIHIYAALDAVRDPAGNIVCRVTLTNPGLYPGCQPFNPFVTTSSMSYILADDWFTSKFVTDDVAVNASGELFSTWAGPIAAGFGFEYRTRDLSMDSNGDPNILPAGTGIRGWPAGTRLWNFLNVAPINGKDNVKEAYAEVDVPLAKDMAFARSLNVNGAVRRTDYSLSGVVTTYKVGGVWQPVEDLRIRGTVSRDIRAPVLSELFGTFTSSSSILFDPHCNCFGQYTTVTGGNPDLRPEIAKTYTAGVVVQPASIPNFSISADWYDIDIRGVIAVPAEVNNSGTILNTCFRSNGLGPECAYIVYPLGYANTSAANFPTRVIGTNQNLGRLATSGFDFEAAYRLELEDIAGGLAGTVSLRALANYVNKFIVQANPTSNPVDVAGFTNDATSFGPIPHWKGLASMNYQNGGFRWIVSARYVGPMTLGPSFRYEPDRVPSVTYFDTTISYSREIAGVDSQLFLTVNNLFNKVYPLVPPRSLPGISPVTATPLYDLMLRYFTVGVKARF